MTLDIVTAERRITDGSMLAVLGGGSALLNALGKISNYTPHNHLNALLNQVVGSPYALPAEIILALAGIGLCRQAYNAYKKF